MQVRKDEDGYCEPIYRTMDVSEKYVKMYDDATYALATLHGCPRLLIEYFSKIMDSDNIVHVSSVTKENFLKDVFRHAGLTYSMISVEKGISKLKENRLLMHVHRGVVQVNPRYFFKGDSEHRRKNMITERIEKEMTDIDR